MPIFNKDLPNFDKPLDTFPEHGELYKGKVLPDTLHPSMPNLGGEFGEDKSLSIDDLANMNAAKPGPIFGSTVSELKQNQRYDFYKPGINYEDIYARTQPWYKQIGNGFVKMGAFAVGTFAQSFNSIPETAAALSKGDLKELSGNDGYVAPIDDWMKSFEDSFPNYYSDYEKAHPFKSILGDGFANFLGDKFAKNLGFMGGAIAGALVQDAAIGLATEGIGEIPLLANQIGKASLYLNKLLSTETKVGRALGAAEKGILTSFLDTGRAAGRTTEQLAKMENLAQLAASRKLNNQFRYGLNLWTSALTEAGVESRDGYRTLKNDLIDQYKLENFGMDPSGKDLQDIEDIATSSMNARMVGNLGILLVSNAVQFENILKPFSSARTGITSPIYQEIAGKRIALQDGLMGGYSEVVPKSILGRVSRRVNPYIPEILTEGVYEEGGQFALERGTYAYYNKKYLDQKNNKSRNDVSEFIDALGQGITDQFTTTAGLENMFIGALTAGVIGKGRSIIDNARGVGAKAQVAAEINNLNSHQLTGVFQNNFENAAQQLQASKDMEAAVKNKDVFLYKNAQYKSLFSYVNSRIKGNRFGLLEEEIKLAKDLPEDQFKQMFGFDANADNKRIANEYLSLVQEQANKIKENSDKINEFFVNPYKYIRTPKTTEEIDESANYRMYEDYKTAMTYFPSLIEHMDNRESSIQQDLTKISPLLSMDLVRKLGSSDSLLKLADEYEKEAKASLDLITEYTAPEDRKAYERKAKDLRGYAEQIYELTNNSRSGKDVTTTYLKLFGNLTNFELNNRDASLRENYIKNPLDIDKMASFGVDLNKIDDAKKEASEAFNILSDPTKGFEEFRKVDETRLPPVHPEGSEISAGREYEINKLPKYKTKRVADDRYQVIGPDNEIISTHRDKNEASATVRYLNKNLNNLKKVTAIRDNGDGTIRVIDAAGDIQDIPKVQILKYTPLETQEEKLAKDKETLRKQQDEIELTNGGIPTGNPDTETTNDEKEGALQDAASFFISGTTESEKYYDPAQSKPHIKRSREFLNNAKNSPNRNKMRVILVTPQQQDVLGLTGLVQMSYGKDISTPLSEIPGANDSQQALVAQVFVIQEGGKVFFSDKNGNKLTEVGAKDASGNTVNVDLNEVIFQAMPRAKDEKGEIITKDSTGRNKFRSGQEDEFKAYAEAWAKYREELFKVSKTAANKYPIFEFTISRGIPKRLTVDGKPERNHVAGILVPDNKIATTRGLVVIPTTETVAHNGQLLKFTNGRPVLQYGDTLQFLNNKTFSDKQANSIYQVIKALSDGYIANRVLDKKYTRFLKNILFYSKSKGAENRFYINPETSEILIGNKAFPITKIAENEKEIVDTLKTVFNNVNNEGLTKNFDSKFIEYYVDKDKKLAEREWKNYQEFLLSSTYPDGKTRPIEETPLFTNIAAPTLAIPYSFEQKYAKLEALNLDVQFVPKAPAVTSTPTPAATTSTVIAGIDFNGSTLNTIKINDELGEVKFTATLDENNKPVITANASDKITELAKNPTIVKKYADALRGIGKLDESKSPEEQLMDFVSLNVAAQVTKKIAEAPVAQPVVQPAALAASEGKPMAPPEVVAEQDIKAKKALGQELISIVWDRLAKQGVTNADSIIGTRETIDNVDFNKFWSNVTKEDLQNLKKNIELKKQEQLDLYDKFKGAFDPSTGTITSNDTSFFDAKIQTIDAELDALEGKPTPTEDGATDGPSDNDLDLRATAPGEEGMMTDEELQLFKEWHAKNVPFIPYEILENIIELHNGQRAWGMFENGVAKFVRGGLRGTEYHEIFEGIWKMLPKEQRDDIINELRESKKDFIDRETRKTLNYATATEKQIKERIADDFSDFRLGKLPARTLGEKIRRFFKAIMDFFKSFVAKPSLKEQLFKAIDTGEYKNLAVSERVKKETPEYRKIGNLTQQETHEFIEDMTARASRLLYKNAKEDIFNPGKITSPEVFAAIKEQYQNERYKGVPKTDYIGEENWTTLEKRVKESLRTLGINFDDKERVDINDVNYNNRDYSPEPFSVDWKKNSTGPLKFTIATMIQMKALNQEGKLSIELPKPDISSVGGYKLVNSSRVFATLLDKLSNTSSFTKFTDKLLNIAKYDSNYVQLFQKFGGKISSQTFDLENFSITDWRLLIQGIQTFTKQKPEALVQYVKDNDTYIGPANLYTATNELKRQWIDNMKLISKKPYKTIPSDLDKSEKLKWVLDNDYRLIRFDGDSKTYKVNTEVLKLFPVKNPADMILMLDKIGIQFPIDVYNTLKTKEKNDFAKAVSSIVSYFGKEEDVMKFTKETIGINGPLSTLAEIIVRTTNPNVENTHFNIEGERVNNYTNNNYPSVFENEFNEVETLDELLTLRPELNDVFSRGAQLLKKGGVFFDENGLRTDVKLNVRYIQGTDNNGKGIPTSKLGLGARSTQEINMNVNGNYYVLIPADGSTEWMMTIGNTIEFQDFEGDRAWDKIYDIFNEYLMDDINLALDAKNREKIRNIGKKASELRFFKDILSEDVLSGLNDLITSEETTDSQIQEYLNNEDIKKDINNSIKAYIEETVIESKDLLKKNGQILQYDENKFSFPELENNFATKNDINKNKISETEIDKLLTFLNTNYIINNIEMHKILFGDPYQFEIKDKEGKIILDETKRVKSFLSPALTMFDHPVYNNRLDEDMNMVGETSLKEGDPGHHSFKPYTDTVTFADDKIVGSLANMMKAYGDVDVADAASWLMDTTHREIMLKNGKWGNDAEAFHQWQMAYTRRALSKREDVDWSYENNPELEKIDNQILSKPVPKYTLAIVKPIVRGVKYDSKTIDLTLDKTSQMPIYYSMVEGKALEKVYLKMMSEKKGYAIVKSGRKVGAEELHTIYNANGTINETPFNNNIQVSWKSYSIQVETSFEAPKEQPIGSQLRKLSSLDLFDNGVPTSETAKKEYERNTRILNEMTLNGYRELLNELGIIDTGSGFVMPNGKAISEVLMREMLRRKMSENAKDTIQLDENQQFPIPFEASPSYVQIRDIMYSMIDKAIGSPKVNGGSYVQAPVTGFEDVTKGRALAYKKDGKWKNITKEEYEELSDAEKKKVALTDDTLKFYEDKDGQRYCEVMLPHWFRDRFNRKKFPNDEAILNYLNTTEEGKSILRGIGFRIPTQAMSSVEVFKVKGFLPQYMGYTVIVPAEITKKAGSDFDIDKLNMYLKATYIDESGDIRLVKYMGSEEATKDFFAQVFDKKLEKKKINKAELFEAAQIMANSLDDPKNLTDRYADLVDDMLIDFEGDVADLEDYLMKELEKLGDKDLQSELKDRFVKTMYKKSLENEYYDSLEKLLTLPENFKRLVSPIDDAGLPKVADRLDELRGYDESTIKNRVLNRTYMTSLRHAFLLAKKWVGIAAVNITGHSVFQKSKIYINPEVLSELPKEDQKYLGDLSVALDHNTVDVDGVDRISMSGTKTADKKVEDRQYISDRLSGYATSFVDVAKDPYILKIIKSDLIVGTFMFLERIGAGKQAAMFLNQPIISEYLTMLDSFGGKSLFTKANIALIKQRFVTTADLLESAKMDVSIENLENNIEKFSENGQLSKEKNAEQILIFDEFLKYAKMAEYNFSFTQAINYDTTKFRSGDALARKQWRSEMAKQKNIISSIDKVFETTFLGDLKQALSFSMDAMSTVFKLESAPMRKLVEDIIKPFGENKYVGNDEFERIAIKAKSSLLDYIVETKTDIGRRLKELLVDSGTSVAERLMVLKTKYPNLQILKNLAIDASDRPDGAKTVKFVGNIKEAYDENLHTGYMRELRDFNDETNQFYKDLVILSLSQGTYQSPVTFRNIVPIEDFSEIITPAMASLVSDESMAAFKNSFYKNNFKNDDIMPHMHPKFFLSSDTPVEVQLDSFGEIYADIYQYYSSLFPNVESLGIKSSDRTILLLNRKYNDYYMGNTHLKVPRVVSDRATGDAIDMLTGMSITKLDYVKMKAKGDLSLSDYFGYQRVSLPGGDPLVTYDSKGNEIYVYKLTNLLGDGYRAVEHYVDDRPSVFQNGTIQIKDVIPDSDIIEYYGGKIEKKDIPSQPAPEFRVDITMSEENIKKLEAGEKTTTVRTQKEADLINIPVGIANKRLIGGKPYAVRNRGYLTIQEAGGKEAFLKSEGVKDESELQHEHAKEFAAGKRRLYVYDIKPLPETPKVQPSRLSVLEEKMKTKGLSPAEMKELSELRAATPTEAVVSGNKPKGEMVKEGIYVNQGALTKDEQLELFNYLKPFLEEQAAKTNKGVSASKMIGLGLRWDYKSNNPGKQSMNIPDVINPGNKNKYGYYNTSINNQSLGQITPRFRELMEKATGVDMTHYDGAIINLYDNESFISSHNDVDESKSAIRYPVIGINLGGTGNFSIESRDGSPKQLNLKAGTGYVFGVDGTNRAVFHRTFPGKQDSFLPELTTKLDGKTYEPGSYRVTITMRRVMPLEENMPTSPIIKSQPTQSKTVSPEVEIENEGSIVYDPEEERVGMTVGSTKEGYINVEFDGDDKVYTFKKDQLELSDAFNLREASRFNTIELEVNGIITVDNANLRLLSVEETDYEDVKFLKLQSKSGLIVPAIITYNEETGKSEIEPNPTADDLGLDEEDYNTDDFKC